MPGKPVSPADYDALCWLVTEIVWRIDNASADTVHELFAEDASLTIGGPTMRGREAIAAWGRERAAVDWVTRHVCANMRFEADGDDRATGTTVVTVYRQETPEPGPPTPRMVAEYHDEFVRSDGGWRFLSRHATVLFKA
jgi:hypothetical protein